MEIDVLSPLTMCRSFPSRPEVEIIRDNVLNTLDDMLAEQIDLVTVEGKPLCGKTQVLAQFARRHATEAICLFVRPASRWSCDPAILRTELCDQMGFILFGQGADPIPTPADDATLRDRITGLERHARRTNRTFWVVVDGLEEMPPQSEDAVALIIDLLPLGLGGFKTLMSGGFGIVPEHRRRAIRHRSYPLDGFTLDETRHILEQFHLGDDAVRDIYNTCRGFPGRIATVQRLLATGLTWEDIASDRDRRGDDLFGLEWNQSVASDPLQVSVLAFLAYNPHEHRVDDIARIYGVSRTEVLAAIEATTFVRYSEATDTLQYVSESFRKYASDRLRSHQADTRDRVIADMLATPGDQRSAILLPEYLRDADRFEELIEHLSPEHFTNALESTQSLAVLRRHSDIGRDAALRLNRNGDHLRFVGQICAMRETDYVDVDSAEIEALVGFGRDEAAASLARQAVAIETRLALLAALASAQLEAGRTPDPETVQQIRALAEDVDANSLGAAATRIATKLVAVCPDIAVGLVERAAGAVPDANALDWALARLSITSSVAGRTDQSVGPDPFSCRIGDPEVRRAAVAASALATRDAASIMSTARSLDEPSAQLFLLSEWCAAHPDRIDAHEVMELGLELTLAHTDYTPQLRIMRRLAYPVLYDEDTARVKRTVARYDALLKQSEHRGPTVEVVKLQLLLAEAELRYDRQSAQSRYADVFLSLVYVEDLDAKCTGLAELVASLTRADADRSLEVEDATHSSGIAELRAAFEVLLNTTADHYHVSRRVIGALACACPLTAYEFANRLNTQARRERATSDICAASREHATTREVFLQMLSWCGTIQFTPVRDRAIMGCVERACMSGNQILGDTPCVERLLGLVSEIADLDERCRALGLLWRYACKTEQASHLLGETDLLQRVRETWDAIDAPWEKVRVGFGLAHCLLTVSPDAAEDALRMAQSARSAACPRYPEWASISIA